MQYKGSSGERLCSLADLLSGRTAHNAFTVLLVPVFSRAYTGTPTLSAKIFKKIVQHTKLVNNFKLIHMFCYVLIFGNCAPLKTRKRTTTNTIIEKFEHASSMYIESLL